MVKNALNALVRKCVSEQDYHKVRRSYLAFRNGFWVLSKAEYKYNLAGLVTRKNCDFMKEPAFIKATKAGQDQYEKPDPNFGGWIRHLNLWAGFQAK